MTTVHPENDAAIALRRAALVAAGKTAPIHHALSRPLECEAEAIGRMINLAHLADNAPLYIVHLSNGLGLDYLRLARQQRQPVWVETCPQYLLLNEQCYLREDGAKYILSPPLRDQRELDRLWIGIADGSIDTVATDHCTFPYHQRQAMAAGIYPLPEWSAWGRESHDAVVLSRSDERADFPFTLCSAHQQQSGAVVRPVAA